MRTTDQHGYKWLSTDKRRFLRISKRDSRARQRFVYQRWNATPGYRNRIRSTMIGFMAAQCVQICHDQSNQYDKINPCVGSRRRHYCNHVFGICNTVDTQCNKMLHAEKCALATICGGHFARCGRYTEPAINGTDAWRSNDMFCFWRSCVIFEGGLR